MMKEIAFELYSNISMCSQISQEMIEEVENNLIQEVISDSIHKHPLQFCYFSISVPKRENEINDDACFTNERSLGIADGVGGWNEYGIDPSLFSNELMKNALQIISNLAQKELIKENEMNSNYNYKDEIAQSNEKCLIEENQGKKVEIVPNVFHYPQLRNPKEILIEAHSICKFYGSATAILTTINFNQVNTVVMGDCRLLFLSFDERKENNPYTVRMLTKEMIHENGTPFQFALFPSINDISTLKTNSPNSLKNLELLEEKILSQRFHKDDVKDCLSYSFLVKEGDIILMGSDGKLIRLI